MSLERPIIVRGKRLVTHSRKSALALTVLGLFFVLALAFDPTAGARLPAPHEKAEIAAHETETVPPVVPALPPAIAETNKPHTVTVQSGDTMAVLLQHEGLSPTVAQSVVESLKSTWDPRDLKIGQEITLSLDDKGLTRLETSPDLQRNVVLSRRPDGRYEAKALSRDLIRVPWRVGGKIVTSLFDAATQAGMPAAVLADVIHAFSYDVDFQREVQPGDSFEVMFEHLVESKTGKVVGVGDVAYASMTLSGKTMQLYRYTPNGGTTGYFNAGGSSVKKALLRTPVDGARISSSFGSRSHPILGYTRMHKGVDFAVPQGTPIMASGDATVVSAGWSNGFGNLVVLKHNATYSTAYGHMSRFAKGIHAGQHVRQGETIGYVGMTGLATGPHLHYEVRVSGNAINPLSIKMPVGQKLEGRELASFQKLQTSVAQRVASLRPNSAVATKN